MENIDMKHVEKVWAGADTVDKISDKDGNVLWSRIGSRVDWAYYDFVKNTLYFFGEVNSELEQKVAAGTAAKYNWKDTGYTDPPWSSDASLNCTDIVFDETALRIKPKSCWAWFCDFEKCNNITNPQYLDTSQVYEMESMFDGFGASSEEPPTQIDLTDWDTGKVENMESIFSAFYRHCPKPPKLLINTWNVSRVRNLNGAFEGCAMAAEPVASLDLSGWRTDACLDMSDMFHGYGNQAHEGACVLDLHNISTVNVDSFSGMWSYFAQGASSARVRWASTPEATIHEDAFDHSKFVDANYDFRIYVPDTYYDLYANKWPKIANVGHLAKQSQW